MSSSQDNFVSTGNATSWGPASQAGSEGQSGNTTTESEGQPENTVTKSEEQPGNTTTEYEGQLGTRPLTHLERIIQAASAGGALHKKTRAALQENSASQDPENNPGLETLTHLERIQRISRDNYAARNYSPYILPANIRSSESQRGSSTRGRQRSQGRGGLNRTRGRGSQSNPPASPLSSDGENPQAAVGTSSTDPNSETTPVYTHEDAHAAYLRSHPGAGNISHVPSTMIHIARASGIPPEVSERLYNQEGDQTMYSPKQLVKLDPNIFYEDADNKLTGTWNE